MKYIMSFMQVGWKCKSIRNWSDSLKNLKWPYEARRQPSPLSKANGAFVCPDENKYLVSYLVNFIKSISIHITLLPILCFH